jgi:membrane protease YdiL (CAAX protease family)
LDFGTGFWTAALGVTLVAVFGALLRHGRATLPIRISAREVAGGPGGIEVEPIVQRQTMRFVWMMTSLVLVANFFAGVPFTLFYVMLKNDYLNWHLRYVEWGSEISFALSLFLLILVAMRPDARKSMRESFRLPPVAYLGVSVMLPIVLSAIWPVLSYVYDRIHWAAFDFSMYDPPRPVTYFTFPIWLWLWELIPALVEEIAWRGFLQPRFVRKYGIARGIFLLGLVWGAFHFSGDFHSNMNAGIVLFALIHRLYTTVALSYVLGWLTIRSRSVLPAALAHGFYNIFLNVSVHTPFWLMPALWAACAWILFRYFLVQAADESVAAEPGPTLEPAI